MMPEATELNRVARSWKALLVSAMFFTVLALASSMLTAQDIGVGAPSKKTPGTETALQSAAVPSAQLPMPDPPFKGVVGKTYKESTQDFLRRPGAPPVS